MALKEGESDLHENLPDEIFVDPLLFLFALLDELSKISSLAVLHDDVESGVLLVHYFVVAPHDVLMLQFS